MLQDEESPPDEELLLLLLKNHLVTRVVDSAFYEHLVQYILNNQQQQPSGESVPYYLSVETIANQLQEAGYEAEAGSLLLKHKGMHPAVQTFDAALSYVTRWFSR